MKQRCHEETNTQRCVAAGPRGVPSCRTRRRSRTTARIHRARRCWTRGRRGSVSQTLAEFDAAGWPGGDELARGGCTAVPLVSSSRSLRRRCRRGFLGCRRGASRPSLLLVAAARRGNILPGCLPVARACSGGSLAALRYRLVPATLSEEECACHRSSNLDTQHTALVDMASALRDTGALTPRVLCAGSLALLLLVTRPSAAPDALRDACVTCH